MTTHLSRLGGTLPGSQGPVQRVISLIENIGWIWPLLPVFFFQITMTTTFRGSAIQTMVRRVAPLEDLYETWSKTLLILQRS